MIAADLEPLATPIADLSLLDGNPRRGDVEAIARSLRAFGQRKPIVARRDGTVIAGNHTLKAATELGWEHLAVVRVDDDDVTASAYALADNRTAKLGTYDEAALAALIGEVHDADAELLTAAGWSGDDLQALLNRLEPVPTVGAVDPDDIPEAPPPCTQRGDVWLLGEHRLMCGDCRDGGDVARLLAGAEINLAFTSPPYAEQRTYDESSGFKPIPPDEYVDWFEAVALNVETHLAEDGSWFVNIKEHADDGQRVLYVKDLTLAHVRRWSWRFVDEFCWTRPSPPGAWPDRFENGWEPVFQFARSRPKFVPHAVSVPSDSVPVRSSAVGANVAGPNGKYWNLSDQVTSGMALPSNVIALSGVEPGTGHTAAFPVGLPRWFAKAYSDPGDTLYDPFVGSGSTILAAHLEGRRGFGMEISAGYCDVAAKRFQIATGIVPVNEATGVAHDFTAGT